MKKALMMAALMATTFVVGMLFFGVNANAYIDPSVMTYVIQLVAAVVVAIGAVVGIYWRRMKKKMQNSFGITEKKEQESDDIIVNQEVTNAVENTEKSE